jgi:hypothetical protein
MRQAMVGFLALIVFGSCGGGGGDGDDEGPVNLNGTWAGTLRSELLDVEAPTPNVTIIQEGNTFRVPSGIIDPNQPCSTGELTGTLDDNGGFAGSASDADDRIDVRGDADQNFIEGEYVIVNGACAPDFGTFELDRLN